MHVQNSAKVGPLLNVAQQQRDRRAGRADGQEQPDWDAPLDAASHAAGLALLPPTWVLHLLVWAIVLSCLPRHGEEPALV